MMKKEPCSKRAIGLGIFNHNNTFIISHSVWEIFAIHRGNHNACEEDCIESMHSFLPSLNIEHIDGIHSMIFMEVIHHSFCVRSRKYTTSLACFDEGYYTTTMMSKIR